MRKGLTTLMTVAIALVSVQAMALAPVIGDIPSPIVGNKATVGGSQTTAFVYPDAFDLNTLATDDNTSAQNLKWSYEIVGTPKYAVNGDASISGTDDVIVPPADKTINTVVNKITGANDENKDGKANTVTIRNINLYPYGGSPSATATDWATNMQAVTFWCSDGNLASSSTVWFYTDNSYANGSPIGWNRLSMPPAKNWEKLMDDPMNGTKPAWQLADALSGIISTHTLTGSLGVCFEVGKGGDNWSSIMSPMPYFQLTNNKVYRIRAKMNSSQSSAGKTPFWDFMVDNWNGDPKKGMNLYGMDTFFMDNEGGANAALQSAQGTDFTMYWAPAAFATSQWSTGAFTTDVDAVNDPELRFRVLDVETNQATLRNDLKFGAICLQGVTVESIDYAKMSVVQTMPGANITSLKRTYVNSSNVLVSGNVTADGLTGTVVTYNSGVLKLAASGGAMNNELVQVTPCTDVTYDFPGNSILDDWPIKWTSGKVLALEVMLDAPDANSAAHPYDVFWMSIEPPTYEVATESYVSSTRAIGSPKTGTAQKYVMFYYTGNETKSAVANLHQLRWRLRFGNSTNLNWPNPSDTNNSGAVEVRSIVVKEVSFPN